MDVKRSLLLWANNINICVWKQSTWKNIIPKKGKVNEQHWALHNEEFRDIYRSRVIGIAVRSCVNASARPGSPNGTVLYHFLEATCAKPQFWDFSMSDETRLLAWEIHVSWAGIAESLQQLGNGLGVLEIAVRFVVGTRDLSLLKSGQTGCVAHPASYSLRTGGSFPAGIVAGSWGWPLTFIMPKLRMSGAIPPLSHLPSWRVRNLTYKVLLWSSELYQMDSGRQWCESRSLIRLGHYCTLCSVELI
jgi:hypothetical protein